MAENTHRILLIDDDLYIRDLYQEVLTGAGFTVEIAKDGKEGYEKITTTQYDLILLDVMLPQLDGIGIMTKLKETESKHAPIILLTNLSRDPILKQAMDMGAVLCLTKADITPDQLLASVQQTLGLKPTAQQPVVAGGAAALADSQHPAATPAAGTPQAAAKPAATPAQSAQPAQPTPTPAQPAPAAAPKKPADTPAQPVKK